LTPWPKGSTFGLLQPQPGEIELQIFDEILDNMTDEEVRDQGLAAGFNFDLNINGAELDKILETPATPEAFGAIFSCTDFYDMPSKLGPIGWAAFVNQARDWQRRYTNVATGLVYAFDHSEPNSMARRCLMLQAQIMVLYNLSPETLSLGLEAAKYDAQRLLNVVHQLALAHGNPYSHLKGSVWDTEPDACTVRS
jgi:hypothetical protein